MSYRDSHGFPFRVKEHIFFMSRWSWAKKTGREQFDLSFCLSQEFSWQSTELMLYAVSLCRRCQDSLQTPHFLFKKYVSNGCSVWSFLWIKFVMCSLWFHFVWSMAVEQLGMKTRLAYALFSKHRRDRAWINDDSIWNKNLATEIIQALLYFIIALYIGILFSQGFFPL